MSGSEDVFAALARAQATVDGLRHHPSGEVRVVLFPSGARMLLAGVLHRLAVTPEVVLRCRDIDMTPPDVPALAADFDVVVTHRYEYTEPLTAPRWTVVPLLREPLDVVLPPGHRLARRRTLRFSDLAEEAWISVDVGWPVDDVLRMLAVQTGISPRVVQRINDFGVTEELVAAGLGVALLPRYSTDDRGGRRLARRPLAGVRAARFVERYCGPGRCSGPRSRWCWRRCARRPTPKSGPAASRYAGRRDLGSSATTASYEASTSSRARVRDRPVEAVPVPAMPSDVGGDRHGVRVAPAQLRSLVGVSAALHRQAVAEEREDFAAHLGDEVALPRLVGLRARLAQAIREQLVGCHSRDAAFAGFPTTGTAPRANARRSATSAAMPTITYVAPTSCWAAVQLNS